MPSLKLIYDKIRAGEIFGKIDKHRLGGSYFWDVLWIENGFIHWRNYGSSANKISLKNLKWIIENIFKTTAEQFLFDYTTYNEWKRINQYYKC